MSLPTPEELREFLVDYGIDTSVVSDSWILKRLNGTVIPFIEHYINRPIDSIKTITGHYSGNGMSTLILRHKKLISFDNMQFISTDNLLTDFGTVSTSCDLDAGILKRSNGVFPKGERNIIITYTVGNVEVPADLKECVLYLLGELTLTFIASQTGGGSPSTDGYSRNFGERGRWASIRQDFKRHSIIILKRYASGIA